MKHLIIVGVGVLSDIVYEYVLKSNSFNKEWDFKGFLYGSRDSQNDIEEKNTLACYTEYEIEKDDVFICSYFNNIDRQEAYIFLKEKGATFVNVIHPSANILSSIKIGEGNVIGAFTTLSAHVSIGNMNIIQDHCNIGHDTTIGDYNHLFVNAVLCGKNRVGNLISIYTGSLIYPTVRIGDNSVVAAGSVVLRHVKEGQTVIGNPAKKIDNIQ